MKPRLPYWLLAIATGGAIVALPGCAVAPSPNGTPSNVAQARGPAAPMNRTVVVRKGMKPDDVLQLLGRPKTIRPTDASGSTSETWIYERGRHRVETEVTTGSQDVPYVDPFTGQMRMTPEPVYSHETTTTIEELHLFWRDGELINWKIEQRVEHSLNK